MTDLEMLEKMRGPEGFRQFGSAKVMRMFGLPYSKAVELVEWLVDNGHAERIDDRPWEVRLI